MAKPATATATTTRPKPANKGKDKSKDKAKTRKPRLTNEDYQIGIFGLKALVEQEEQKEIIFAEQHFAIDIQGDDGEITKGTFSGSYDDLCKLYDNYGQPHGSVLRTKAMALIEKYGLQIK